MTPFRDKLSSNFLESHQSLGNRSCFIVLAVAAEECPPDIAGFLVWVRVRFRFRLDMAAAFQKLRSISAVSERST